MTGRTYSEILADQTASIETSQALENLIYSLVVALLVIVLLFAVRVFIVGNGGEE